MDPLSIIASVIGIAGAALTSCQILHDSIGRWRDAPETTKELLSDLKALSFQLSSLERLLREKKQNPGSLSEKQIKTIQGLDLVVKGCQASCDSFRQKLANLTRHSGTDSFSKRDKANLYFHEGDIKSLKQTLSTRKETLIAAIGVVALNTSVETSDNLRQLAADTASQTNQLAGQITGVESALGDVASLISSMSALSVSQADVEVVVSVLNQHGALLREQDTTLKQCLAVAMSSLEAVSSASGKDVDYARTFNKAKQFVGNIGYDVGSGPATSMKIGTAEAGDESRQIIGNVSGSAAGDFFKNF